jgi:hypothetical protein
MDAMDVMDELDLMFLKSSTYFCKKNSGTEKLYE